MLSSKKDVTKFVAVRTIANSKHWLWNGYRDKFGNAKFAVNETGVEGVATFYHPHQLIFSLFYKVPVEPGYKVTRKSDTCAFIGCMNPEHLQLVDESGVLVPVKKPKSRVLTDSYKWDRIEKAFELVLSGATDEKITDSTYLPSIIVEAVRRIVGSARLSKASGLPGFRSRASVRVSKAPEGLT